jgi:hypothetical protein
MPDEVRGDLVLNNSCHADRDGDCEWVDCPQLRDKEPGASGRHCPLYDEAVCPHCYHPPEDCAC